MSASGKQLQIIDEEGNMFATSKIYMQSLLDGKLKMPFILLSRLPHKVDQDRFKKSPLYDPNGVAKIQEGKTITESNDALSKNTRKATQQRIKYKDVEW